MYYVLNGTDRPATGFATTVRRVLIKARWLFGLSDLTGVPLI